MYLKTHAAGGLLSGLIFAKAITVGDFGLQTQPLVTTAACVVCATVGGLLPDVDLHNSTAGQHVKPLAVLFQLFFGHRSFFHSPLMVLLFYEAMHALIPQFQPLIIATCIGMLSHILLDALNKAGVPLFFPIPYRFWAIGIRTGSSFDHLLAKILLGMSIVMFISFFVQGIYFQN